MNDEVIRPATDRDLPILGALRWQWLVEENGTEPSVPRDVFVSEFAAWLRDHSPTHGCIVAEVAGTVVGMAIVALVDRVPTPGRMGRVSAELQCLYMAPAARNRGIGARLIDSAVGAAGYLRAERITVHSSERAVTAYARAGFASSERFMDQSLGRMC